MNNKGVVGEIIFGMIAVTLISIVTVKSVNINIKTSEGQVEESKVSLTELTKRNGATIWCKMKGRTDCDFSDELWGE